MFCNEILQRIVIKYYNVSKKKYFDFGNIRLQRHCKKTIDL